MKTVFAKSVANPAYRLVNADGQVLGRLAVAVARYLIGKNKVNYTPNALVGDAVVVINAKGIKVTGAKEGQKVYRHYTTYPGGLRQITLEKLREKSPTRVVKEAVRKMLPKNRLGERMLKRLRVYAGADFKEKAQKPVETKI